MASIELGRTANTDLFRFVARKSIVGILSRTFLRYKMVDENDSLAGAEKLSREGYAIIVAYAHPTAGEPPRVAEMLVHKEVMGHKKIITPIAQHQDKRPYRWLGKITDVTFESIVTDNSVKTDRDAMANKGKKKYLKATTKEIGRGGIILLAPQQERLPFLGQPKRAVRAIMGPAEKENYTKYAVLIVGFEAEGKDDYSTKKARGLNLFKRYNLKVGALLTREEILIKAAVLAKKAWKGTAETEIPLAFILRFTDEVVFEELRKAVPDSYK